MKKRVEISVPKIGMNRATSAHMLSENEYSFMKNGASYDEGGEKFNLTLEHSNILASRFKGQDFRVVGVKTYIPLNTTYYLLTNPTTGVSEIGKITNTKTITELEDKLTPDECVDCDERLEIANPLEEIEQTPHQVYETLLNDECNLCLGFSIDEPIIDIEIKQENVGTVMVITPNTKGTTKQPPRIIRLDDIDFYKTTGDESCGKEGTPICVDCDKMRIFKLYKNPTVSFYKRTTGGKLQKGNYEVFFAYSDVLGQEFTSYESITPQIPIFDESNIIHEASDNNAETNFSIKVEIKDTDKRFEYYKIVFRYYDKIGSFQEFQEGIHTISDTDILITETRGAAVERSSVAIKKQFIDSWDGLTAANNYLFGKGIKEREPINLQPVVSLMGLGLEWQSYIAKEGLYKNPDSYKFLSINRDENVAYSIAFVCKDGYETNPFIFIPRGFKDEELVDVSTSEDPNIKSIISNVGSCDVSVRNKIHQFKNMAGVGKKCTSFDNVETIIEEETITAYTTVEDIPTIQAGTLVLGEKDIETFIDLVTYINANKDSCPELGVFDDPDNNNTICTRLDLNNLTQYNNPPIKQYDDCCAVVAGECEEDVDCNCVNCCENFVLDVTEERAVAVSAINERLMGIPKDTTEDYTSIAPPVASRVYENGAGGSAIDYDFSYAYHARYALNDNRVVAQSRKTATRYFNKSCKKALELKRYNQTNFTRQTADAFYHENLGATLLADLTTTTTVTATEGTVTEGIFTGNLHKNAMWFEAEVDNREVFFINISESTGCFRERINNSNEHPEDYPDKSFHKVRVNFFANCDATSSIYSEIVDLRDSKFIEVNSTIITQLSTDKLYIAIDTAIIESKGFGENWEDFIVEDDVNGFTFTSTTPLTTQHRLLLTCGAWDIADRDQENKKLLVDFAGINIKKFQKYTSECKFETPVLNDCEPFPHERGEMAVYESQEEYPDNTELYDSSKLVIKPSDIPLTKLRTEFEKYYVDSIGETYTLNSNTNFSCKNIRFYRLPDNSISPFMRNIVSASNSESIIYPIGATIDPKVIDVFLNIGVKNNLITKKQKEDIVSYKIYRSDIGLDRSVEASGLLFNTKVYNDENGDKVEYSNVPFNTLGGDKFFVDNTDNEDYSFNKATIHSPELDYYKINIPTEMSISTYMKGRSNTTITEVENHSKMVVLGAKAKSLASTLATIEVTAEIIIQASQALAGAQVWAVGGFVIGASLGIPAFIASGLILGLGIASGIFSKYGRIRYQWLETFENLGEPINFGYYTTAVGNYNYLEKGESTITRALTVGKHITPGFLNISDTVSGGIVRFNNIDREESAFISTGDFPIIPSLAYSLFDNNNITPYLSSQVIASEINCPDTIRHPEALRNVASPYVALKNYLASQYGTINSIKWVYTGYEYPMEDANINDQDKRECKGFLGGDTFIARHSVKRKAPIFTSNAFDLANRTPFAYKRFSNYGEARYYIDYKIDSEFSNAGRFIPDIDSKVETDCRPNSNNFYEELPSKFYLYMYGICNFLTETRINTNFRNARKERENQFYPQNTDYVKITQEKNVSIGSLENFFYNNAYSNTERFYTASKIGRASLLPTIYSKDYFKKLTYNPNSVMYSRVDNNQNSLSEPWLQYRPNDRYTFDASFGRLSKLKGIENGQVLATFENLTAVYNAIDVYTQETRPENQEFGTGGIFANRPKILRETDIGVIGSQNNAILSTEFGHFIPDTMRGQIFRVDPSLAVEEVSRYSNGRPNNMDVWFKEHLPFKITEFIPEVNIDNHLNGVGIHMSYDSKFRRVILTKKDYIPLLSELSGFCFSNGNYYDNTQQVIDNIIQSREEEGFTYVEQENCDLKFTIKEGSITNDTDVYAIFDTTSMQFTDGQIAKNALESWFNQYKIDNPNFNGNLYILPYGIENYVGYPKIIEDGDLLTTSGVWTDITILPPNYNTVSWEPPKDLLLLAFVDETNSQYHGSIVSGGFTSSGIQQPTTTYINDFIAFKELHSTYNYFRAAVYPIVRSLTGNGGALVLQALAAIEGTTLSQQQIDDTNTLVDVSILLTENPYENAPIPNTSPQEFLEPLKNYGWVGQYDKTSPASEVFSSLQFQEELDFFITSGEDELENTILVRLPRIDYDDPRYYKDVSFTITYKPETGYWESYMDYTPNYYVSYPNYFQSGKNSPNSTFGVWSHLLTNKSHRVFYGQKFPYTVEYPIKNEYISKQLESVSIWTEARRWHSNYDYSAVDNVTFTEAIIYNDRENSGKLKLIQNKGTVAELTKYPKTVGDAQEILISSDNQKFSFNYFFNRVKSNKNNQPIWNNDVNNIDKILNPKAVSFYGKQTLEHLHNSHFLIRLIYDGSSQYDLDLRWIEHQTKLKQ